MVCRVFQRLPLAADAHRNAVFFAHFGKIFVDALRIGITSRHTGNHKRKRDPLRKEKRFSGNVGEIYFRERIVDEFPMLKPRALPTKCNIAVHGEKHMILFA